MGYELRREVRAVLPPSKLTPLERHLILEIADQCSDKTREGWPGAELLALLIDKNVRTVEETLKGIAKKWVELRIELGKGVDGRPYYSHRSKRTTFRFPKHGELRAIYEKATGIPWASSASAGLPGATQKKAPGNSGASDQKPPAFPEEAPEISEERPRESRGPSPQSSSPQNFNTSSLSDDRPSVPAPRDPGAEEQERDESTSSSNQKPKPDPRHKLAIRHGAPEHLAAEITNWIEANNTIDSIGWWITADRNTSLTLQVEDALNALAAAAEPATEVVAELVDARCDKHPRQVANSCGPCASERASGPRCTIHPGYMAQTCGGCRADRLADDNVRNGQRRQLSAATQRAEDAFARAARYDQQDRQGRRAYTNPPPEAYESWESPQPRELESEAAA